MTEDRLTKIELLKKIISVKQDLIAHEQKDEDERRKIYKQIDRHKEELKALIYGNKDDIDRLFRRDEDQVEDIKEVQSSIQWFVKAIIGTVISLALAAVVSVLQ